MSTTKSLDTIEIRDQTEHTRNNHQDVRSAARLYRFISTLDADIHITLVATDDIDRTNFAAAEALPIGGGTNDPDTDTKLVTDGSVTTQVESTLLTENWPWVQFGITAQSTPTTGEIEIREIEEI